MVVGWIAEERALREQGEDGEPQWYDRSINLLQLGRLDIHFAGGSFRALCTYQNDSTWGLWLLENPLRMVPAAPDQGSIYRVRSMSELPIGPVTSVDVRLQDGDI